MIQWSLAVSEQKIIAWFRAGEVFIYPTESVYGLGGDPGNTTAVTRILELKQRAANKGMIMVVGNWCQTKGWVGTLRSSDKVEIQRISAKIPTTFILPAGEKVATEMKDMKTGRVALRISQHPVIRTLCAILAQPIISTSANISGQPPARTFEEVQNYFPMLPIIKGDLGGYPMPSRIIDWETREEIRAASLQTQLKDTNFTPRN